MHGHAGTYSLSIHRDKKLHIQTKRNIHRHSNKKSQADVCRHKESYKDTQSHSETLIDI